MPAGPAGGLSSTSSLPGQAPASTPSLRGGGARSGIGSLPPRLVVLSLCFNGIEALPPHLVAALPLLQELDLSHNRWAAPG